MFQQKLILAAAGAAVVTFAGPAMAQVVLDLELSNHPAADSTPPGYGLRLDNLFTQATSAGSLAGGLNGLTSFDFDADESSVRLTVEDLGTSLVINISGVALGGIDEGATYGYGAGLYEIDFTYSVGVMEVPGEDGGYAVDPGSTTNQGTITSLGNADVAAGTEWTIYQQLEGSLKKFEFLRDNHRFAGFPELFAQDLFVGRAWVTYNDDGTDSAGIQDWLFLAPVPSPATAAPLALAGLAMRRRR